MHRLDGPSESDSDLVLQIRVYSKRASNGITPSRQRRMGPMYFAASAAREGGDRRRALSLSETEEGAGQKLRESECLGRNSASESTSEPGPIRVTSELRIGSPIRVTSELRLAFESGEGSVKESQRPPSEPGPIRAGLHPSPAPRAGRTGGQGRSYFRVTDWEEGSLSLSFGPESTSEPGPIRVTSEIRIGRRAHRAPPHADWTRRNRVGLRARLARVLRPAGSEVAPFTRSSLGPDQGRKCARAREIRSQSRRRPAGGRESGRPADFKSHPDATGLKPEGPRAERRST
jgi:hypothetical protein